MASIKVKFRPSTVAEREGTVFYQIIHERKVRQLLSNYHIMPKEWDDKRSTVITGNNSPRRSHILSIRERIRMDLERLSNIIVRLDHGFVHYCVDDIISEFNNYSRQYSLFNFIESLINRLKQNGRIRTAETYRATLNSFRKFRNGKDIFLECLSSEIMEEYESWLRGRQLAPNTISFYIRILRATYNRAAEDNIITDRHPFRRVYTGIDKTVKRALPLNMIKKIKALDLSQMPAIEYARDMFLMSFYLRGMSFIDMAYLRKSDLKNGYLVYRRRKTGQQLIIRWTSEMQSNLDKYPENRSEYLLPIIRNSDTNARCAYRNAGYNINHNLKKIGHMIGISIPLTLYVARHSWASAARAKGIPVSVISEGMGHDSETTTRIYLASLDTEVVDRANSVILSSL